VYDVLKPVLVEKEKAEAHLKANADKMEVRDANMFG